MNVQTLREKRATTVAEMRKLIDAAEADGRDMTEEEQGQFDALEADANKLGASIDRISKTEQLEVQLQQPAGSVIASVRGRAPGPEAKKEFSSLGEFFYAVRFNPNDQRLANLWHEPSAPHSEMRMDTGTQGGFMVPVQMRNEIMRVEPLGAVVRPRARVIPAGSPPDAAITIPTLDQSADSNLYGGVSVQWVAEGGAKPETTATLRTVTLQPYEVAAHTVVTDKLLRNWQAAESFLGSLLREAVVAAEDRAFLQGDGVGKPLGVLNAPAVLKVNRAGANDVSYADILSMDEVLLAGATPVWVTTKRVVRKLREMEDTEGHLIWQDNARVGEPSTLLGYPVVISDRIPTLGSRGDLNLFDLSYYLIKDGSGPFVAASEHVHFVNNKTAIKIFWNVDGQPWLHEPVTRENGETQSPFVVLDVPA